jgi:hypothetical protein
VTEEELPLPEPPVYVPQPLPTFPAPPVAYQAEDVDIPGYAPYSAIPATELPYLREATPMSDEVEDWYWVEVVQKFVNKKQKTYLTKDQFILRFYPELFEERYDCRKVSQFDFRLLEGEDFPEHKGGDEIGLLIYVQDESGNVRAIEPAIFKSNATRDEIMDFLIDKYGLDRRNFRAVVYHPRMFDFDAQRSTPVAISAELYGDISLDRALSSFPASRGLEEKVVPLAIEPARRRERRYASVPSIGETDAKTVREKLHQLARNVVRRKERILELQKRAGRTKEEIEREWETTVPSEKKPPTLIDSPESLAARALLTEQLERLYAYLSGESNISAEDAQKIQQWIVSSVLSGKVAHGVDYTKEFERIKRNILQGKQSEKNLLGWISFLAQIEAIVDEVKQVEARSMAVRDRQPIFDPETGEVVDYTETLKEDYVEPVPVSIMDTESIFPGAESAPVVRAPFIQCHKCKKWRVMDPGFVRTEFSIVVRDEEGGMRDVECLDFGFIFEHIGTGVTTAVPMNADYIVAYDPDPSVYRNTPLEIRYDGRLQGFGLADITYEAQQPVEYVVSFYADPDRIESFDPKRTELWTLVRPNPISPDGTVYVRDPSNTERIRPVPEGRALYYYCKTSSDVVLRIPLDELVSHRENV